MHNTVAFIEGAKDMVRGARSILRLGLFLIAASLTAGPTKAGINPALWFFLGFSKAFHAVSLSPDGRQAASGGQDNLLRLWDVATGLLLRTFDAQTNSINGVAFSPDGRQVLTGGDDKLLRLWDVATGQSAQTMEGHTGEVFAV